MKINKLSTQIALAALISCAALASAVADEYLSDVRIGSYSVFYHTSADDISGPFIPQGENLNLRAENLETLYFGYIVHLPQNFAVELAMGWPPLAKVDGRGPATVGSIPYNGQEISSARWIAPTLLFEYNFLDASSTWRPYIGAGVNYTTFYDRDSTAIGSEVSGGPTRLSLTASVGPAVTGGVTYRISDRWAAHASYSWSQVKSTLTADTDGVIRTTRISFGPQALVVSVGYSF
jgi:outer membrane protein